MRWGFIRSSAVLACVLAAGHSLLAQSLLSVPDNAIAMIKVNNLEQTSRKAGSLLKQWGLVALNPMLADPLTSLQTMTNLSQGVNRAGEAAMIFINPQAGNQPRQPAEGEPYIILVPVSDYDAFLKNFPDAATEEDMTSATLPLAQQNCFITKWDNYAAISPQRALLATRPKSTNASGLAAKELAGKDIIAYINFPGFKAQAQQGLGFVRMLAIGSLDQSVGQDPEKAKLLPVAKAAMAQLFNGLDHFINETKAMTVGLQLSDNGVQTTFVSEFDPKSYLGQIASSWKNSNANFLTGLPDGNYAMIGSVALDGATFVKLVDDATGPVVPELVKAGDAGKSLLDCIAGVKLLWTSCKSEAFGLTASSGKAGESPIFDIVGIMNGDAQGIMASQKQVAQNMSTLTNLFKQPNAPQTANTYTPAARTVGGVTFDQMVTTIQGGNNAPEAKMIEAIYGPGGMSVLYGIANPTTLVFTSAKSDESILQLLNSVKAQKATIGADPATRQVDSQLPANRFMTFYIHGNGIMTMVSRGVQLVAGTPLDIKLPPNLPPVGVTLSTDGSAVREDVFVPSTLVQSAVAAGLQQAMKQQQNQQKKDDGL